MSATTANEITHLDDSLGGTNCARPNCSTHHSRGCTFTCDTAFGNEYPPKIRQLFKSQVRFLEVARLLLDEGHLHGELSPQAVEALTKPVLRLQR